MRKIDFHNHVYPPEYVKEIEKGPSAYRVTYDADKNPILHSPGDYNILVPGHRCIDYRKTVLQQYGLDTQLISFTAPGTLVETPARSTVLSQKINDLFAGIQSDDPEIFPALGTLPLNDPAASAIELERALTQLGLKGITLFSNANGVALSDKRFWPIYEKANDLHAVFFIHPTYPVGVDAMQDYMLMPLVGFLTDTTLAAASLVFSGVFEEFQNIRWVLGHLGGAAPYLAERFDRGYEAFEQCRRNITKPPSEYLKELYYDTVNFDVNALRLALDFVGSRQLLAGSDYPHQIGSIEKMFTSIAQLQISDEERAAILGGNAAGLLGICPKSPGGK